MWDAINQSTFQGFERFYFLVVLVVCFLILRFCFVIFRTMGVLLSPACILCLACCAVKTVNINFKATQKRA